ncbi:MAG: lipoyl(octanoyl) transferase LipB [Gammaproteobacteria bacterium]|nr:lipoyl(octanoyl) transferase LipB [Gammaproteobacteria bacterium]
MNSTAERASPANRQASSRLLVRELGQRAYGEVWDRMRRFTAARDAHTDDELWLLEHAPVYTQGQAGRAEHVVDAGDIPVIASDRGGQVTYHGPGQLVAYTLIDLRRARLGVRTLVHGLEQSVIDMLAGAGVDAARRPGAPGVYVGGRKVCALGLRVRGGSVYHGLALNVDVALAPFGGIEPCGYRGLEVTRTADLGIDWSVALAGRLLARQLARHFGFELLDTGVTSGRAAGS